MFERAFLPAGTKYTLLCICISIVFATHHNTECIGNTNVSWNDAVKFCYSLNSSLATINKTTNMFPSDTCLYGNNPYWTGRYKVLSPWIEITGCFDIKVNTSFVNQRTMDVRLCFLHCNGFTHFALQNNTCICLNGDPAYTFVTNTSCVPSGINEYIVGTKGFIAVYRNGNPSRIVRTDVSELKNVLCAIVSCESENWTYHVRQCRKQFFILCQNMESGNSLPWNNASGICNGFNSYLAGANISSKQCQGNYSRRAFWTFFRRYVVVVENTFLEPHEGLHIISCEYTSMKPRAKVLFDSCSEQKGAACTKINKTCPCRDVSQTADTSIVTTHTDSSAIPAGTRTVTNTGSIAGQFTGHTTSDGGRTDTSVSSTTVTPTKEKSSKGTTVYIAVGCVGAVVVVILLTILVCCVVRNKRKKTKEDQERKEKLESSAFNKTYSINQQTLKQENGYHVSADKNQAYEMIDSEFDSEGYKQNPNNKIGTMDKSKPNYSEPWSHEIGIFKEINLVGSKLNGNNTRNNNIYKDQQSLEVKKDKQNGAIKEYSNDDKDGVLMDGNYHQIQINNMCDKEITGGKTDEEDYDQFERNKVNTQRPASNYDHFHLRQKSSKHGERTGEGDDDLEDYDHLQTTPKRQDLVDSTYDHTQAFAFEDTYDKFNQRNQNPASDTYDHLPNEDVDGEDDYATAENEDDNDASGDYEISDEVPAVAIKDGGRDSYYTTVTLSEMEDQM